MSFSLTLQIKGIFTSGVNLCSDLLRHKVEIKIKNCLDDQDLPTSWFNSEKIFINDYFVKICLCRLANAALTIVY